MSNIPEITNYAAIVATLSGMDYEQALSWVTDPARGFTPEVQRYLLSGRSRCRCLGCSWS